MIRRTVRSDYLERARGTMAAVLAGALLVLSACGTAGQRLPDELVSAKRWTGSFQPTKQQSGAVRQSARHAVHGRVSLTPTTADAERTHVALSISAPGQRSSTLRWAVVPGRCGTAALPLLAFDQFPMLEVGTARNAQVEIVLPLRLESGSPYHVNVYEVEGVVDQRARLLTQPQLIVSCANIRE